MAAEEKIIGYLNEDYVPPVKQKLTELLSTRDKHPFLDDPEKWDADLFSPAFDMESYQERIDRIVGKNLEGKSIIKLAWAPKITTRVYGEEIPRYWYKRRRDGEGWVYYTVKRYVFEQRQERAQYYDAWEATRYSLKDPVTQETVDKGPPPDEFYTFAHFAVDHDPVDNSGWPSCCERRYRMDRGRCYGYFRFPSDDDLELLRHAVRMREQERKLDPYRPMTSDELFEIEVAANKAIERDQEEQMKDDLDRLEKFTKKHAWRLGETDPGVLHHGREHFLGKAAGLVETESGLWVPEATSKEVKKTRQIKIKDIV